MSEDDVMEPIQDDEEFCPDCFAGMESDQHFRACVEYGRWGETP